MNKRQLFVVILVLCWISSFFLPWFVFPLISFCCGLLWFGKYIHMFWVPATATAVIVLTQILFISFADKFRTADTIGAVLGDIHAIPLIILTVLTFAVISGLAGLSGVYAKSFFTKKATI